MSRKLGAIHIIFLLLLILSLGIYLAYKILPLQKNKSLEIDTIKLGFAKQSITIKPNLLDKKIAYGIWVELSTRKIGLEIDMENDVIVEIYDSWYMFFSIARDMIKDIPISKLKNKETRKVIHLSIDILNKGLRPHLTKWQAKYRRWYQHQIDSQNKRPILANSPQEIQKDYPEYSELVKDLHTINESLIYYRNCMHEIVFGETMGDGYKN